jgi:integrase
MAVRERKTSDGRTVWYVDFYDANGRRIVEKAGFSKRAAEALYKKRWAEVKAGTYVNKRQAKKEAAKHRPVRFGAFVREVFLPNYAAEHSRSTYYEQQARALKASAPFWDTPLKEITRDDISAYRRAMESAERKPRPETVKKRLTCVGTIFREAVVRGLISAAENPCLFMSKPRVQKNPRRPVTREEWRALEAEAARQPGPLHAMMRLSLLTGARLGDVVKLRWERVNLDMRVALVSEDTKTGARPVRLSEKAVEIIQAQQPPMSPYVFARKSGEDYTSKKEREKLSKLCKRIVWRVLRIRKGVSFANLRATTGAIPAREGVSIYQVSTFLGHKDVRTTQDHYAAMLPESQDPAVRSIEAWATAAQDGTSVEPPAVKVPEAPEARPA